MYLDCVESQCGNCNTECADFISCAAACDCGDSDCALACYEGRSRACVTCQTDQGTCIANNCLDATCN